MVSQTDFLILGACICCAVKERARVDPLGSPGLGAVLAVLYLYRDSIFRSKHGATNKLANGMVNGGGAGGEEDNDFVSKLKSQVGCPCFRRL